MAAAADTEQHDGLRVFISYSRRDMEMADKLVAALESAGFSVVIDRRDLPYGEEWQAELSDFIRTADTVVWLVSPHSLASHWCNWELGEVQRLNKRLVPVAIEHVDPDSLPKQLGRIHILPAESVFALDRHMAALVEALNTDRGWIKEHTRLADRARQWIARDRPSALLLRGVALRDAQNWKDRRPRAAPPPSEEILDLLLASRKAQSRRQRWAIVGSLALAVFGLGLAGYATWQRGIAVEQRALAEANEARAQQQQKIAETNEQRANRERDEALRRQSQFLADQARQLNASGDSATALAVAVEAMPDATRGIVRPYVPQAEAALADSLADLRELSAHEAGGIVTWLGYSPDGSRVMAILNDGSLHVWNAATWEEMTALEPEGGAGSYFMSPVDGAHAVLGRPSNDVVLWDLREGKKLVTLQGVGRPDERTALSPDGKLLAGATGNGTVSVWRVESGVRVADFNAAEFRVLSIAWAPDSARFATAGNDGAAQVWDAAKGTFLFTLRHVNGSTSVNSVGFSPDGKLLLTAGGDLTVRLWNAQTGEAVWVMKQEAGVPMQASFSPDGKRIVIALSDGMMRLVQVENAEPLADIRVHSSIVTSAVFMPDGSRIMTRSYDGTLKLWTAESGLPIATLNLDGDPMRVSALSPDGSGIATSGIDGLVHVWDGRATRPFTRIQTLSTSPTHQMMFSADGSRLVTRAVDNETVLWDSATGGRIASLGKTTAFLRFLPDGRQILAVDNAGIGLWDASTGARVRSLNGLDSWIKAIAFSWDGSMVAASDTYNKGRIWNADTGAVLAAWEGGIRCEACIAFSADGKMLARINMDGRFVLRDIAAGVETSGPFMDRWGSIELAWSKSGFVAIAQSNPLSELLVVDQAGKTIAKLTGLGEIEAAHFRHDGTQVMVVARDGRADIWDIASQTRVVSVDDPDGGVSSRTIEVEPNERRLLTGGNSGGRFWDMQSGTYLGKLKVWTQVYALAFAPDGAHLAVSLSDGTTMVMPILTTPQDMVDAARAVLPRALTDEQLKKFFLK